MQKIQALYTWVCKIFETVLFLLIMVTLKDLQVNRPS